MKYISSEGGEIPSIFELNKIVNIANKIGLEILTYINQYKGRVEFSIVSKIGNTISEKLYLFEDILNSIQT